ncbi:MAG: hypothetical protein H0T46_29975, partial [Deltaproteobacteria bacterium]|nr:hypothetical protein [Deltaproteobacteria bacterium]
MKSPLLLAAGAIAVLGAGVWIGRSSSAKSEAAPAEQTEVAPRSAAVARPPSARP